MGETMRRVKQKVEVSTEEDLLRKVQREKQYEEQVRRGERIVPNKKLERELRRVGALIGSVTQHTGSTKVHVGHTTDESLGGTQVRIGHEIKDSPQARVVRSPITVKIVSDIHETLNRLKDEVTTDQKGKSLDQVNAGTARTYIDKIKQEAVSTNPNKEKMISYLKSVQRITGYVAEKKTTIGKVRTPFGEAFSTIQSLFEEGVENR